VNVKNANTSADEQPFEGTRKEMLVWRLSSNGDLLTLAVAAVATEVAATCVLKLPVALGADADHVGHDGAGDGLLLGVDLRGVLAHRSR
jgi:hypothetical protein